MPSVEEKCLKLSLLVEKADAYAFPAERSALAQPRLWRYGGAKPYALWRLPPDLAVSRQDITPTPGYLS
jgi:hypothetical protein